ncbi:MAG: hypothetical protein COA35_006030 [Colwellia sp.]|jgi:hypothetical protein|nr:hypothetical protein [Colwellia sp.]
MSGKIKLPHHCPKCGKPAHTLKELETLFGMRQVEGGLTNQSYCRECR